MHDNSRVLMRRLLEGHVTDAPGKSVVDVGSRDTNGSYRDLIVRASFARYTGIDICDGKNVDIVVPERGLWDTVQPADVVISGQCVEHVRRPWRWIKQVESITTAGGVVIIVGPWIWHIHRHPIDCWRILPDGMTALLEEGQFEVIDVGTYENDCYGVGRKPK